MNRIRVNSLVLGLAAVTLLNASNAAAGPGGSKPVAPAPKPKVNTTTKSTTMSKSQKVLGQAGSTTKADKVLGNSPADAPKK